MVSESTCETKPSVFTIRELGIRLHRRDDRHRIQARAVQVEDDERRLLLTHASAALDHAIRSK